MTSGTAIWRFGVDIIEVSEGAASGPIRSHRNCGSEPVEIWALSRQLDDTDTTKGENFWEASPDARQKH